MTSDIGYMTLGVWLVTAVLAMILIPMIVWCMVKDDRKGR